jgi:hypothetical protein
MCLPTLHFHLTLRPRADPKPLAIGRLQKPLVGSLSGNLQRFGKGHSQQAQMTHKSFAKMAEL